MRFQLLVWPEIWSHLFDLAIAFTLALPIGWDREKESRSAGSGRSRWWRFPVAGSC